MFEGIRAFSPSVSFRDVDEFSAIFQTGFPLYLLVINCKSTPRIRASPATADRAPISTSAHANSMVQYGRVLLLRAIPEWRESYLGYERLKRLLERLPNAQSSGSFSPMESMTSNFRSSDDLGAPLLPGPYAEVESIFFAYLDEDLKRMNELAEPETASLEKSVALATAGEQRRSMPDVAVGHRASMGVLSFDEVAALYCRLGKLRSFLSLNTTAVRKIVKKYDKSMPPGTTKQLPLVMKRIKAEPFTACQARVDDMVWRTES